MPRLIGLCGFIGTGRDGIAAALSPDFKRVGFMDGARADLAIAFKKLPAHKPEATIPLLLEYRRTYIALAADAWRERLKIPAGDVVVTDVYDREEARWLLVRGFSLFRVHKTGALPFGTEESKAADSIYTAFDLPQIENDSTPQEAATKILGYLADHGK